MRNLVRLIEKHYFVFLFLLLEGLSLAFMYRFNPYQRTFYMNFSRNLNGIIHQDLGEVREYLYLKREVEKLHNENVRLKNQLSQNYRIFTVKNDTSIIDTVSSNIRWEFYFLPADIINNSVNKQYNYLTLDRGRLQGLEKDMAVISDNAVVGVITGTSNNFSTVIPIINRDFRVGSKIEKSEFFGILEWDGRNPEIAKLKEIPLHVEVKKGDNIVTSGYSAIFPEGIMVGKVKSFRVTEGNFYDIDVQLSVNFRNLQHVYAIKNLFGKEKQELEKLYGYD